MGKTAPVRTAVLQCPDWPVTAAGVGPDIPAAVFSTNRVVASSAAARAEGVRQGHRRREAQARCPELIVLAHDPDRDAREFEPVVSVVEEMAPGVTVVAPGIVALRSRGPSRYLGGDDEVVELLSAQVDVRLRDVGAPPARVGIADGLFAAITAAREHRVVPPGKSPEFLAALDISALQKTGAAGIGPDRDALVDLLRRLGLRTLGAFAALSPGDVASRFDAGAVVAHRLARGMDPYPVYGREVPIDLEVTLELDPPADQVQAAAFAVRGLAEQLQQRLGSHGLACTRLLVSARTANGEEHARSWRGDGAMSAAAIADRTRWQLDGWLTGRAASRPTSGVVLLRLVAEEVIEDKGLQLTLWGGWADQDARMHRTLARVQGMLGPDAVLTPVLGGGRGPREQIRLVPWQQELTPALPPQQPWPGRLPGPHPTTVLTTPQPVQVNDATGQPVTVSARQVLSAAPATIRPISQGISGGAVLAWAGPWTVDERWWDTQAGQRIARLQVVVADEDTDPVDLATSKGIPGRALLLVISAGQWSVEGVYG